MLAQVKRAAAIAWSGCHSRHGRIAVDRRRARIGTRRLAGPRAMVMSTMLASSTIDPRFSSMLGLWSISAAIELTICLAPTADLADRVIGRPPTSTQIQRRAHDEHCPVRDVPRHERIRRQSPDGFEARNAVDQAAALTSIFFGSATAAGVFGNVTVNTPLPKSALILSRSIPSGSVNVRWNEP